MPMLTYLSMHKMAFTEPWEVLICAVLFVATLVLFGYMIVDGIRNWKVRKKR